MPQKNGVLDVLLQLMRELRRNYDARAEAVGLTMSRARALTTLAQMEGETQAALAARLDIEAPTLKRQIDALESGGFVERRPIEGDARKNALYLTQQGHDTDIVEFTRRVRADLIDGLSEEEIEQTKRVLERLLANVAKLSQP
ncbi:MarR family transcriptional regulator [Paracoccus caeni]|uniref:MarR family transcriptional regulator n=1 Tax=Paracoccus caeni TaxID=657651 RepID=A0A934SLH9_9RHOB|nr:MarR family transcriptional regulator [Paracoccus caeni]MBK4217432.1 MarR family transcriptional regulator [Paracoccus caeni]